MRASIRITAATLMAGAAAFAITGLSAPAQAQGAPSTVAEVRAAPGWHHIRDYPTLIQCRKEGERYLANGWAVRYECRSVSVGLALWVLTNP